MRKKSRAVLCDNSQRDAGAACWDRGLQKNLPCLRLSAMFNWNRTRPWKGIHRFGEIKCSIWTNGEMTTPRVVKVQSLELLSCANVYPLLSFFSLMCFHSTLLFSKRSLHPLSLQVHIQGFHWVSGLRGTLDISSCRHICPPSWSPSSPGSPSGSTTMPRLPEWPWVGSPRHCRTMTPANNPKLNDNRPWKSHSTYIETCFRPVHYCVCHDLCVDSLFSQHFLFFSFALSMWVIAVCVCLAKCLLFRDDYMHDSCRARSAAARPWSVLSFSLPVSLSEPLIGRRSQLIRARSRLNYSRMKGGNICLNAPHALELMFLRQCQAATDSKVKTPFSVKLGYDRSEQQREWLWALCALFLSHTICFLEWDTCGLEPQTVRWEANVI